MHTLTDYRCMHTPEGAHTDTYKVLTRARTQDPEARHTTQRTITGSMGTSQTKKS